MPPRRKTTTRVRLVLAGSAKATRVVTSCAPSAAMPALATPNRVRRRVKPRSQRRFCAVRSALTCCA